MELIFKKIKKVYKTKEQNNWTVSEEHDFCFSKHPGVQRQNKGMDSCLLPLHLGHLVLSPVVVAMLLTPPFDVASPQNLLAGFWQENEQFHPCNSKERKHEHHCQPGEKEAFSCLLPLSQMAEPGCTASRASRNLP